MFPCNQSLNWSHSYIVMYSYIELLRTLCHVMSKQFVTDFRTATSRSVSCTEALSNVSGACCAECMHIQSSHCSIHIASSPGSPLTRSFDL